MPTSLLIAVAAAAAPSIKTPVVATVEAPTDFTALASAEWRFEPQDTATPATKPEATEVPDGHPPFGSIDTWRINLLGGAGSNLDDDAEIFAGVGLSYFIAKRLSLEFELNGWYFNVEDGGAGGISTAMLLRWHFWASNDNRWTLFGEAGAGLLLASDDVPSTGSEFNFTPMAGGGVSIDLGKENRLLAGLRWHHISNANTRDDNPGQDSVLLFAGLSFPF